MLLRPLLFRFFRDANEQQEGEKSEQECGKVQADHGIHAPKPHDRRSQNGGQNGIDRIGEIPQSADLLKVFLGQKSGDCHLRGGLLHGVHQPSDGIDHIDMPDRQGICFQKNQNNQGGESCHAVTNQHGPFLVPAVCQGAGKDAEHHVGGVGTNHEKGRHERGALLAVGPYHQRISCHGAPQGGKGLTKPKHKKLAHFTNCT